MFYQNPCAGRCLLRKILVHLQTEHHLLLLLLLCIAWLCSDSATGKETPQINFWPSVFLLPRFFLPVPFYLLGKRLKLANIFSLSRLCAQAWMCAMGKGPEFHRCSHGSTGFKGNLAISIFPFRHPCHRSSVRAWSSLKLVCAGRVVFLKCLMCFSNRCL